ncbi:AraC family transcriptional regulator [Vibrio sp. qd031]|uniref:helix-turn-helix domain-containing protein n=1 Tax=Vibrio sp. qd031 TaxID=1603038 RepID=UPI00117ECEA6|nr:AraC family transcriptional regulator [Vibrio sp. qd031]
MDDLVALAITMVILGQIGFCFPQFLIRAFHTQTYLPLAVFFLATAVIVLGPAVSLFKPGWSAAYVATIFPAWLILAPAFWLYVEGLTSDIPWRIQTRHALQLFPFIFGVIVAGLILSLPPEIHQAIFNDGADIDSGFPLIVVISMFVAMLIWLAQSGYYVFRIIIRLSSYRKQLKDLFASNEQRELGWLSWVLIIISGTWLFSFASLVSTLVQDNPLFGYRFGLTLILILVWTLAYWGLRQKPGFDGRYMDDEPDRNNVQEGGNKSELESNITAKKIAVNKYERSALSSDQAQRIADKINATMEQEQLHLDSSLSLHKLARHVAISPNYISQTLNETMGTNFFDFVNRWRIETAKPKIIENKESVLNVALEVGFNARSSFYKAFKKETGKTPTEFRNFYEAKNS